jgi:hypothetical protein
MVVKGRTNARVTSGKWTAELFKYHIEKCQSLLVWDATGDVVKEAEGAADLQEPGSMLLRQAQAARGRNVDESFLVFYLGESSTLIVRQTTDDRRRRGCGEGARIISTDIRTPTGTMPYPAAFEKT